ALQYADFAHWQRGWLQGEVYERQLEWWRGQLGERPPVLDLPTDRPRPAVLTSRGGMVAVALTPELTAAVHELARGSGGTVFTLLLAVFQLLLHRLSGQDRVSVGTPVANRTRPEIEGLIGFFVNTVVLPADLSGDPTTSELLGRVRDVTLGAFDHQDFPFDQLVAALETDRDTSRQPLFQAMFAIQNNKASSFELPGLALSWIDSGGDQTQWDLVLSLGESGDRLAGALSYNADLFDAATAERWAGWFVRLVEAVTADPERRLSELPLREEAQRLREERAAEAAQAAQVEEERRRAAEAELEQRRRQLSSRRSQLSPERLAVLQKWVQGKGEGNEP
ncbi:MAG TPA: condensation domain-containing protein, partial [Thermoanaerobaculia bacterium]|nr:condensation domain-containing protein [Thermoanaerobaculia bacterium]